MARRLTAHEARWSPWWTCSRSICASTSSRSMVAASATACSGSLSSGSTSADHASASAEGQRRGVVDARSRPRCRPPADQELGERSDPRLTLIGRHQVRPDRSTARPGRSGGGDPGRSRPRCSARSALPGRPPARPDGRCARLGREGLPALSSLGCRWTTWRPPPPQRRHRRRSRSASGAARGARGRR